AATTAWTPQTSARRRAVVTCGVRPRIGAAGRSRAARSEVNPDAVYVTVAAGASSATTWRSEKQIASAVVASAGVCVASRPTRYAGSASTRPMMRSIIATASTGYLPDADSADSI